MITKSEFLEWRDGEVVAKLHELCNDGKVAAIHELVSAKGEVADVARGAVLTFDEVLYMLRTGEGVWDTEDEQDV